MGLARFADHATDACSLNRSYPNRISRWGHKNYNEHYNYKHYNYKYHGGGRYYRGNRYWGHRYGYRPYGWQTLGCIAVGPVWYCP